MKKSTLIFVFLIIGGLYIFLFILKPFQTPGCGVKDSDPFCGTKNLSINAKEGRSLFNTTCAACHKLDKDMTGPALRDMGKTYDTLTIFKYLQGDKTAIKSKDYPTPCMRFPELTVEDISNIIKYTDDESAY